MKKFALLFVLITLAFDLSALAVGGNSTEYVGGTINAIKQNTDGKSSTADEKVFVFEYKHGKLNIPYDQINSLEYGEKAGRRVGLAIAVSPIALLSKKKKHFLTVGYLDDGDKQQAAVFEIGKESIRVTLATLQARTGKKVEYQDEDARKDGGGD